MSSFETSHLVRFSEIDAAGIVFYPRFFEMINDVVEDWFAGPLKFPFSQMHLGEHVGIPTRKIECEFFSPSYLGDELEFNLDVLAIGRTSVSLEIVGQFKGEKRLAAHMTFVHAKCVDGIWGSKPLPDDLRGRIETFLKTDNHQEKS